MTLPAFQTLEKPHSVAGLTAKIKRHLSESFAGVRVQGEISGTKIHRSGHWYFSLKDDKAELSCVCFRYRNRRLRTRPRNGLAVIATGDIDVFEKAGRYQLYVVDLEPVGAGALHLQFERLKQKLMAEGLFEADRKRPLPSMPRRIGIVTSPDGAAIQDMRRVLERRFPCLHVQIYPAAVQGPTAAHEIAAGLRHFSEGSWAEVVIVGRGGGSIEDLWSFNEEVVARAIAASRPPVISAVGHETDFTIADFVADYRAATPSVAAEVVVPKRDDVLANVQGLEDRAMRVMELGIANRRNWVHSIGVAQAGNLVKRRIDDASQAFDMAHERLRRACDGQMRMRKERLEHAERQLAKLDLRVRLVRQRQKLGTVRERLLRGGTLAVSRSRETLGLLAAKLDTLSPVAILERGYSILADSDGTAVRDSRQVLPGDALTARLHRGGLELRVVDTRSSSESKDEAGG